VKLTLTSSGAFLSPFFKKKLNPLLVKVISCKQIPPKEKELKPIYFNIKFVDGKELKSIEFKQNQELKVNHSHVYLMGD